MKPLEKVKAQKTLRKIETGDFNENDIDSIFMALRAYSHGNKVFREVADFVAHNDKRNKGLTTESLEALYFSFKYFNDYVSPKNPLDITAPFPLYIKKLMKYQVDKCDETYLKNNFNMTRQRFKSRIDNIFSEDKKKHLAFLKKPEIPRNILDVMNYVMGFIFSRPAFDQDQVISGLLDVIQINKLDVNIAKILEYSDKITICVMLLLHNTKFEYGILNQGYCKISCENPSIPYNQVFIDKDGNPIEHKDSFGSLQVLGYVELDSDGKPLVACYPLMTTNISAEKWCDEDMVTIEQIGEHSPDYLYRKIMFDSHLYFNDSEKIGIIAD